ncbi:helix-turn-helix domain-containing protein [Chloroflexota bacterium]
MKNMTEKQLVYTAAEVSHLLCIGKNLVYDGIRNGQIPSIKIGRRLLIPRQALEQLLNSKHHGLPFED